MKFKAVPKAGRIRTYKRAIELIENNRYICDVFCFPLCILLPCIYYKLNSICDLIKDKKWETEDTLNMFPELTKERIQKITGSNITTLLVRTTEANLRRIEVLKEMIQELEK